MLNIGIIGNGSIADAHRAAYKRLFEEGKAQIVAVCDIREERLDSQYLSGFDSARKYTDIDEMLKAEAGKLDYVDICVPTFIHSEFAIKAMKAGFDVVSEKPMARTVEQAEEMVKVSKETGRRLMIAYCNRFYSGAVEIKKLIDEKTYGEPISAVFHRDGGRGEPFGWNNWFMDAELSGGAMLDLHIHDVDMIRMMFGMPKAVSTVAASYVTKGGYDILSTNYMFDNGFFVTASCDWLVNNNRFDNRVIRVNFRNGYVYVDRTTGRATFKAVSRDGVETDLTDKITFDAYYSELDYFCNIIAENKPLDYNLPEESIDSVKIVMAEIKSAESNGEKVLI